MMGKVRLGASSLQVGELFRVSFHRTLRVPDDGKVYPLPPGLGTFPLHKVSTFRRQAPTHWDLERGYFLPLYQREALWLSFDGPYWRPNAVKVGVGQVNAITGKAWDEELHVGLQDYLVCPNQPWLDGCKTESGIVRQFVAMPLGEGYTVSEQILGGGGGELRLLVIEPEPGRFPDQPPPGPGPLGVNYSASVPGPAIQEMGLAAGGKIEQKIYPDPYGIETWDQEKSTMVVVYLVNSTDYQQITGKAPPPTSIDANLYTRYGFPWFKLYDEELGDIEVSEDLAGVSSLHEVDAASSRKTDPEDASIPVDPDQVRKLKSKNTRKKSSG